MNSAPCSGGACVLHAYPTVAPSVCVYAEHDFAIHYHGYYDPGGGSPNLPLPAAADQLLHVYWPPAAPGNYSAPGCDTLSVDQIQAVPYFPG
jgi:hypothetical protein